MRLLLGCLQVLTDVVANVADFDGDGIITNYEFYTALDPNQVTRHAPSSRVPFRHFHAFFTSHRCISPTVPPRNVYR